MADTPAPDQVATLLRLSRMLEKNARDLGESICVGLESVASARKPQIALVGEVQANGDRAVHDQQLAAAQVAQACRAQTQACIQNLLVLGQRLAQAVGAGG